MKTANFSEERIMSPTLNKMLTTLLLALSLCTPAFALSLDEAKASGLVGERATGYLGIVTPTPSAELKTMVDEINRKRRAIYQRRASKAGVSLEIMELRTGQRLQQMTPPGQYIQDGNGQWRRK
jgi:uncharacterized protein YdbL (DUF1318 family)